jgi:hypothetical protein
MAKFSVVRRTEAVLAALLCLASRTDILLEVQMQLPTRMVMHVRGSN